MSEYLLPLGYALLAWWLSTGMILYLNNLPTETYRWSMFGATSVLLVCLYGLASSSAETTLLAAFLAFTQALVVWGWLEMSYFMGFITGPRKHPCPPDCGGWRRFTLALKTSLHHEIAIIAFGLALVYLTWDAPNQVGTWTFATLWLMRWSAKLNLFFGVPNINDEWLPEHLRFLKTYIRQRPMNLLFPFSVSIASVVATLLVLRVAEADTAFEKAGFALVATMLALAILEHWFLVLPVKDSALWEWALRAAGKHPTGEEHRTRPVCKATDSGTSARDDAGRGRDDSLATARDTAPLAIGPKIRPVKVSSYR